MMQLLNRILNRLRTLQQRFYSQPGFIQTREGIQKLAGNYQQPQLVLGRGLCMYRCHDYSNVPQNRRSAALESSLELWSPFERTGFYCHWRGGYGMVWFWDEAVIDYETLPSGKIRVVPETVFLSQKRQGCARQVCNVGVELQYWNESVLLDSLWFATEANAQQVEKFCIRYSQDVDSASEYAATLASRPWHQELGPIEWVQNYERHLVSSMVLLIGVLMIWQETRIVKAEYQERALSKQLLAMEDGLAPLLAARNALDELVQRNNKIVALTSRPSQASLMMLVSKVLPEDTALFREWHFQQGALRFIVEDSQANTNTVDYVKALRAETLFADITAEQARGENRVQISLRVLQN